jgi:hypothetical protein
MPRGPAEALAPPKMLNRKSYWEPLKVWQEGCFTPSAPTES